MPTNLTPRLDLLDTQLKTDHREDCHKEFDKNQVVQEFPSPAPGKSRLLDEVLGARHAQLLLNAQPPQKNPPKMG